MLVIFCGWAGAGKTTVARLVRNALGLHYIDMDDLRAVATGRPMERPSSGADMEEERVAMLANYGFMAAIVDWHLRNNRSLMLSATFSKSLYWEMFQAMIAGHSGTEVKVIHCLPTNDDAGSVEMMLRQRLRAGYNSSVNTSQRYSEVKDRFTPPPLPHLTLSTWGGAAIPEESARKAVAYIQARNY